MYGDSEQTPKLFRQICESRALIVTAETVAGEWSDEMVEATTEMMEHFLRSLASPVIVRTISCALSGEDGEQVRLTAMIEGQETDVQLVAAQTADELASRSGINPALGTVIWHLSTPASMREAWGRDDTMRA